MKTDEGTGCCMCCLPGRDLRSLCLAASAALGRKNKRRLTGAFPITRKKITPSSPILYQGSAAALGLDTLCAGGKAAAFPGARGTARQRGRLVHERARCAGENRGQQSWQPWLEAGTSSPGWSRLPRSSRVLTVTRTRGKG